MAEEQTQVTETETVEQVDTQQEKTVSVAEMQRRLKQAEEKHEQATQVAIQQALEKFKAESELSGKELEEYRKQEAEREKQALLDKIAGLEREQTKRELTDEAIKTLSTRQIPVNDKILGFVVKDTAEDTLKAIDDIESIIKDVKSQFAQTEAPKVSTSLGGGAETNRGEIFRNANIRNKR